MAWVKAVVFGLPHIFPQCVNCTLFAFIRAFIYNFEVIVNT